jgi:heme-degrading monooxygenase HmoA
MFARVETFQAEPSELDDLITSQHHATGRVRTMNGNMGGYVLVDRDKGRVLGVTFWQNEDDRAVAESEFEASPHHGEVELFSIAMQQSLRPA